MMLGYQSVSLALHKHWKQGVTANYALSKGKEKFMYLVVEDIVSAESRLLALVGPCWQLFSLLSKLNWLILSC